MNTTTTPGPAGSDEWPPPPTLRSVIDRFGTRFLTDSLGPIVGFIAVNAAAGLTAAIIASSTWSIATLLWRRRRGTRSGPLVWANLAFVAVRGIAGTLTRSDVVFFGPGVVNNFVIAAVFAGSVAIKRPAVGHIAPVFYAFPDELRRHRAYRRIFGRVTLAWAFLLTCTGTLQVVLLARTSANSYLLSRALVSWPLTAALFTWSIRYPRRAFAKESDLADRLERAVGDKPAPALTQEVRDEVRRRRRRSTTGIVDGASACAAIDVSAALHRPTPCGDDAHDA